MKFVRTILLSTLIAGTAYADAPAPTAPEILHRVLESDPWGLGGGSLQAHITLIDKQGTQSALSFSAKSRRLQGGLAESIVRFAEPPDLAGAGFLQVQKADGDDDRFLFLPELKRSRRISGNLRSNAFMGTDLSFADLDRRDLRSAAASLDPDETLDGRWDCYVLEVKPSGGDSQYSRAKAWVRKDNYLPIKMQLFDRSGQPMKLFSALEIKRVSGHWYVSKARIQNQQQNHTTEFVIDRIAPEDSFADDEFTVRALEKAP